MAGFLSVNEGTADRAVRIVLGVIGIALVFFGPKTAWGWFGLIPLVTGLVGICPLYSIFGLNTGAKKG